MSVLTETLADMFQRTKRRKVERREREVERCTERMEVTMNDGRKVVCGRNA
jgi:hypothetical protein